MFWVLPAKSGFGKATGLWSASGDKWAMNSNQPEWLLLCWNCLEIGISTHKWKSDVKCRDQDTNLCNGDKMLHDQAPLFGIHLGQNSISHPTRDIVCRFDHGANIGRPMSTLFRPRLIEEFKRLDIAVQARFHNRQLSGQFHRPNVHESNLLEITRQYGRRRFADRLSWAFPARGGAWAIGGRTAVCELQKLIGGRW